MAGKKVIVLLLSAVAELNKSAGEQVELPETEAKDLIDKGLAEPVKKSDSKESKILLLVDCVHGKCGQIVSLAADDAKDLVKQGVADDNAKALAAHADQSRFTAKEKIK